ncbi:ABC transporter ATP-binding protein [Paenibacillus sp. TRM 82003]|nr:ABC transporter ATP-binding protein [Paenibacillus sp. TRM 82003]
MIEIRELQHEFLIGKKGKERKVPVLKGVDIDIAQGEIVAIVGRSGSGKSTLLNAMSGYIRPSSGLIRIQGKDMTKANEGEWADFRLSRFGFVFQSFQLIPSMTAFENIELPLVLKGVPQKERQRRVLALMERVGLTEYASHYPGELSGGQQQRVSVARAFVLQPPIVLADEPTGSLDEANEQQLLELIRELNRETGATFVIITHDDQVAAIAHRKLTLLEGRLMYGKGFGGMADEV